MRALTFAEYGPASVLRVADVPEPHAGRDRIRVRVRASGLTPADCRLRAGRFRDVAPLRLPHVLGMDAAGVVDEVGPGVTGIRPGDEVFGLVDVAELGGANAEYAVLAAWARKPDALSWEQAGGAAGNVETATRALDRLRVGAGTTLLIEGAAGGVGTVAVQLAAARGATVIGTAGVRNHTFVAGLGATPTTYGPGLEERVATLAPDGVDAALDCAGSGSLPALVDLAGSPDRVVTIADTNAAEHGVHHTRSAGPGADPQALEGLAVAAALAGQGRFTVPVAAVFPLDDAAAAHRLSETGHARGKIVLTP
ncbi:NADP-dependent oxidoreductase [Streptomyces mobaraensis NBRC 13819 = DSM 40847]|uniref:Molecular chaperone GroES n=1 Tax=Streptomyces mobaraensis (strain ATCC 29032 / DSM 40847 / JCM 4168 / NBRC 13819 / NCIMB 11159 / IPCR 16-22) TaxID=1223523 RepID=M3AAA1_STRM1|nr:NADP-dependent oxidoreductase [Streptomyces mobaraensis]EMF02109.1 molecular chaperone GroES [Streptomyces mobaraensis NBRC 13819 = DSM 40847]QTT76700.1 NADP-dependent oxidoreductase [Streptomyces mobaraensis NBRC 13819 = DSM 40847]